MGGATRAGRDHSRAVAREASSAVKAGGIDGFRQGQIRQDGGELVHGHYGEDLMLLGKR
jgi:hypothetical protein